MIPLGKLRDNLRQSQQWGATFKSQIKGSMEEITIKKQAIVQFSKTNLTLQSSIESSRAQLKSSSDQKLKLNYKTDKIQIKLEQLSSRLDLYQQIERKKQQWNQQLTTKMMLLEVDIERGRHSSEGDVEGLRDSRSEGDRVSEASLNGSVGSSSLSFKEDSIKQVMADPRAKIEEQLTRVKKLETEYMAQIQKCRKLQGQLQSAERKGLKLQAILSQSQPSQVNKENDIPNQSPNCQSFQKAMKDTTCASKTLRQLEGRSERLSSELGEMYAKIQHFSNILTSLAESDTNALLFHREVVSLEREVKKERNTMQNIKHYLTSARV